MMREPAQDPNKRPLSKGEKLFDFTVYGLMNWVGTFVITVPVAWWMLHGHGKPYFDKMTNWFEGMMPGVLKFTDKILFREPASAEKLAERAKWWGEKNAITTSTFMGGNIMLLPIWLAERAKVPIVKATNESMGDKTDPATIEEAPQTDGWSLIKARLAAWVTVFTTFTALGTLIPKTFGTFEREFGEKTSKLMGGRAYKAEMPEGLLIERAKLEEMGEAAKEQLKALNKKIEPFETKRFQLGKIASWDTVATTAAVVLLYMGSKFFTEERQKKEGAQAPVKPENAPHASKQAHAEETPKVENLPVEKHPEHKPAAKIQTAEHHGALAAHAQEQTHG